MAAESFEQTVQRALAELAPRLLSPDRPRLAEARAAVAGIRDPAEAWEALAARGVVPFEWFGDPRRRFRGGRSGAVPKTVDDAVALAADPRGIATVEALARDCAQRLAPWMDGEAPTKVIWRVADPWDVLPGDETSAVRPEWFTSVVEWLRADGVPAGSTRGALDAVRATLPWSTGPEGALGPTRDAFQAATRWRAPRETLRFSWAEELVARAFSDVDAAASWARCVAQDTRVATPRSRDPVGMADQMTWADKLVPAALIGMPYASLPDPLAPVLSIWQLGYAVAAVEPEAIKLGAPAAANDDDPTLR